MSEITFCPVYPQPAERLHLLRRPTVEHYTIFRPLNTGLNTSLRKFSCVFESRNEGTSGTEAPSATLPSFCPFRRFRPLCHPAHLQLSNLPELRLSRTTFRQPPCRLRSCGRIQQAGRQERALRRRWESPPCLQDWHRIRRRRAERQPADERGNNHVFHQDLSAFSTVGGIIPQSRRRRKSGASCFKQLKNPFSSNAIVVSLAHDFVTFGMAALRAASRRAYPPQTPIGRPLARAMGD